jgi:glutamyl-tRNA reductase
VTGKHDRTGKSGSELLLVGLSHHTAPVELRERVAFAEDALEDAVRRAAALGEGEALLLSTCNRVELYLAPSTGGMDLLRSRVEHFFATAGGVPMEQLTQHLYARDGLEAVRHLFRVAASLDSMVVGEPQILGQVKSAFTTARRAGTVGATLERTVQRAFAVAKRVRTETAVARASSSIAAAGVELARHIFGELEGKAVLLLGAGKMADLAARHLRAAGCRRLIVLNRTLARAEELARRIGGEAHPWEELEVELTHADIVLCSTGATRPVVERELVQRVMRARRGRWLCFIDIAVPRDVAEEVGRLDNVYLYDVDALTQLVDENLADRRREAEAAEQIVVEEIERFSSIERSLGVVPTIKVLRERFLGVAREEAERTLGRLQRVNEADRREVHAMAEAIVNKLLHHPLTTLKREAESEELIAVVRRLFALSETEDQPQVHAPPQARGDRSGR